MTSATHSSVSKFPHNIMQPTMTHPDPPLLLQDPPPLPTPNDFDLLVLTHNQVIVRALLQTIQTLLLPPDGYRFDPVNNDD
jgi:hypothetical protein